MFIYSSNQRLETIGLGTGEGGDHWLLWLLAMFYLHRQPVSPCHLMRLVKSGRTVRIMESLLAKVDCTELYVGLECVTQ